MTKVLVLGAGGQIARWVIGMLVGNDDIELTLYLRHTRLKMEQRRYQSRYPFSGERSASASVANLDTPTASEVCMEIQDAQREMRFVYIGGFWGQLVSSVIWLISATLGTWVSPRASILTVVIGGFFIFPLTHLLLRLSPRRAFVSTDNPFTSLGMQVAFVLPLSMLLLVPVGLYRLNWFFPALMVLVGAHYLPFATLYGMRMFLFLAGILVSTGVVIAVYFAGTFSLGSWIGGLVLFVFAWIGRSIETGDATTR